MSRAARRAAEKLGAPSFSPIVGVLAKLFADEVASRLFQSAMLPRLLIRRVEDV